jgi:uncharacterized protein (TIGR02996 family)
MVIMAKKRKHRPDDQRSSLKEQLPDFNLRGTILALLQEQVPVRHRAWLLLQVRETQDMYRRICRDRFLDDLRREGFLSAVIRDSELAAIHEPHMDLPPAERFEALVEALDDRDPHLRGAAAGCLRHHAPEPEVARFYLAPLLKDEASTVRWTAAIELIDLGPQTPGLLDVLVEVLQGGDPELTARSDECWYWGLTWRGRAAEALPRLGLEAQSALPALQKVLATGTALDRVVAARALSKITGQSLAAASTVAASQSWDDPRACSEMVTQLVMWLGDQKHDEAYLLPDGTVLGTILSDGTMFGTDQVVDILAGMGPTATTALLAMSRREDLGDSRREVLEALGQIGRRSEVVLPVLAAAAGGRQKEREWARRAIGFFRCSLGSRNRDVPLSEEDVWLRAMLEDSDDTTRLIYADWLEERGDPRSELVRLDVQLMDYDRLPCNAPERPELHARARTWLARHGWGWAQVYAQLEVINRYSENKGVLYCAEIEEQGAG